MKQDMATREAKLKAWLKTKLPQARDLSISPFERAPGGANNENYFFELRWRQNGVEKAEKLVFRCPPEHILLPVLDLKMQFRVTDCLQGSGLPVPKTFWFEEDKKVLGVPFFIMGRVDGQSPPEFYPSHHGQGFFYEATPAKRAELWWRAVVALAKMHSLDWQRLGLSFVGAPRGGTDALDRQIAYWEKVMGLADVNSVPVLMAGFDWVKKNRFVPKRTSLCMGDPRLGNMMYRGDQIVAVLDWDLAHIEPPEADLIWFVFVDYAMADAFKVPRLEGLPGMEETVKYYEGLTGRKAENLFYHQVFQALKMAVASAMGAKVFALRASGDTQDYPVVEVKDYWGTRKLVELLNLA
ncbi:MAG: phosphotransferase family protein [Dehalococcoidia bacterium]